MLKLERWTKPLEAMLQLEGLSAEDRLEAEAIAPLVVFGHEQPAQALHYFSGVFIPPHESLMLWAAHRGAANNINLSSRGTSKSSTWCVLYAGYQGQWYARRKIVTLSATGFRGGQQILEDLDLWLRGGWDSQQPDLSFMPRGVDKTSTGRSYVNRNPSMWQVNYRSHSRNITVPTTKEDSIRGLRGHLLFVDEANTFDDQTLAAVIAPFLNVLGDFEHGGARSRANAVYYSTTIDYQWRAFNKRAAAARAGTARDYEACRARDRGDMARYRELESKGLHRYTYTSFDYQDVLIRDVITTREGAQYRVHYPNPKYEWYDDPFGLPFSTRDADGQIQREDGPRRLLSTYPINKRDLEQALIDGTTDETIWLREQKNVLDTATGDVFPHSLIDRQSCESQPLIAYADLPARWQDAYAADQRDFVPPVLWECADPCVLGVDVATGDRDFAAFVVIRIGPLSAGEFDPMTGLGRTEWSNVVWCEQSRLMSPQQIADKIWALKQRYNLHYEHQEFEPDHWKALRAIGLDSNTGGGTSVRDSLVFLDQDDIPPDRQRIYDPLDNDPRIEAYREDRRALPMLDVIRPTDEMNDKLVDFLLAQMKVSRLYLPKVLEGSRVSDKRLLPAYAGAKTLAHQYKKIQQQPTKHYRRFYMPGSEENIASKKDMFSASLYAVKQLRAHLIRFAERGHVPAHAGIRITQIGKHQQHGGRHGRSLGSRF